jgi:hypothetical protein
MVASGSRTMIAGSLSGCIAGFRRSCRFSRSSGPRRWCVGIGLAFAAIGGGDRPHWEGRPQIETELHALIQRLSVENPLWGAPRIHGELLKLGFEVAQSSVAKYMVKRRGFDLLYAFVIVRLDRRELIWINATANPTAEWVAGQITEAFPLG